MNAHSIMIKTIVIAIVLLILIFIRQLTLFSNPEIEKKSDDIINEIDELLIKQLIR